MIDVGLKTTQYKKRMFLEAYRKLGNIMRASERSGVLRRQHYRWLENDPKYKEAFEDAQLDAVELLEEEARRRAYEGFLIPVFYKGEICGEIRKYSDKLMIFLLKGAAPEKYGQPVSMNQSIKMVSEKAIRVLEDDDWYKNCERLRGLASADGMPEVDTPVAG